MNFYDSPFRTRMRFGEDALNKEFVISEIRNRKVIKGLTRVSPYPKNYKLLACKGIRVKSRLNNKSKNSKELNKTASLTIQDASVSTNSDIKESGRLSPELEHILESSVMKQYELLYIDKNPMCVSPYKPRHLKVS